MKFIEHPYEVNVKSQFDNFVTKQKISIANYLKGTMMVTGLTALMTLTILLLFGVKYAFFFGSFLAVLPLIPYIGNLVGMVVILLYVYITKDSWSITLFVFIALYFSHMIQENFLKPKLLGDKMEMNAAVVFTSVIVGGLIWGFSGMILFIPFAGIVKAFIESSPASRNFAIFFESH